MRRALSVALLLCAAVLALAGCSVSAGSRLRNIDLDAPAVLPTLSADGETAPARAPDAARGSEIYEQKCIACHGINGEGDGARAAQIREQGRTVANLILPARARAARPSDWHTIITNGRIEALMPGFSGSLNAQDRWDVQAYVWSLGAQPQSLAAGRSLYATHCASCHGTSSAAPANGAPSLSDALGLADRSLADIAGKMTLGDAHRSISLSEAERFQVADAVRALGYSYADPAQLRQARVQGDGTLVLRALNGTANAQTPPANALVVLRALDRNGEVFSRTAQLASSGVVTFAKLPQRDDFFYQAEFDYQGGRFYGSPAQLASGVAVVSDVLAYYETTTDAATVSIDNVLIAVQDMSEGEITVVEVYEFAQNSDRAFVGNNGRTLRITTPADATNVRFDGLGFGRRFIQDGETIHDTEVVVPGTPAQRITVIYEVPYRGARAFERTVFYPVTRWTVLVPDTDTLGGTPLRVSGAVKDEGVREADGTRVRLYSGKTPADARLRFELNGQPSSVARPGDDMRGIGIGLIALALALGLGAFLFLRVRALRSEMVHPAAERRALVLEIAQLDDTRARGGIDEIAYARERARLKAELTELWQQHGARPDLD